MYLVGQSLPPCLLIVLSGASFRKGQGDGSSHTGEEEGRRGRKRRRKAACPRVPHVSLRHGDVSLGVIKNTSVEQFSSSSPPFSPSLPPPKLGRRRESVCIKLTGHLRSEWQEEPDLLQNASPPPPPRLHVLNTFTSKYSIFGNCIKPSLVTVFILVCMRTFFNVFSLGTGSLVPKACMQKEAFFMGGQG